MTQTKTQREAELEIELAIVKLENARLRKHIADLQKSKPINPYFVNSTINETPLDYLCVSKMSGKTSVILELRGDKAQCATSHYDESGNLTSKESGAVYTLGDELKLIPDSVVSAEFSTCKAP